MKMDSDMKIIYSRFENHSPRDLAFTNEGINSEKQKMEKIIVRISNSFQKNTQYVDIMLKKRKQKRLYYQKFL